MEKNFWPDFNPTESPSTPKSIIQEAGKGLEEKTDRLVTFYQLNVIFTGGFANASYSLYARQLQYHYPFLKAKFPITGFYPVELNADKMPVIVAKDERELIQALVGVFQAPETVATIKQLISLSH
jgi:hypothetical protein